MDKFLEVLGAAGYPTTIVGGVLLLFFYLRKQESGVRADINGSLQRLQEDNQRLEQEATIKEALIDQLRKDRREAEDRETAERRKREEYEAILKREGLL